MNIILILIPVAFLLAFGFVATFIWCAWRGQYDDLETPAHKILLDDSIERKRK